MGDVGVVVGVMLNGDKFLVERRGLNEKIDSRRMLKYFLNMLTED